MFDRMPKIIGVMWPRLRQLSGNFLCTRYRHSRYKAAYQIWSL